MVLDNLGDSLKRTIKKIANAVHVDAKLVKEVVRDIQRALLQADVNVKLVLELSKKIEQRALEEKPPTGMTNREHVIHIVYDELVHIVGASRELPIKKQVIMMVGLYGQGKCVHEDSEILLGSGEIQTARALFETFRPLYPECRLEDGTILDITDANLTVPSFNPLSLKMENKPVTHLWRLAGKKLLEVSIDAGNSTSVKVTPEHPFFALRDGELLQIRADQLKPDDYIAVPRRYSIQGRTYDLLSDIKGLDLDICLPPGIASFLLFSRYDTIKEALEAQNIHRNYCKFTSKLKQGVTHISLVNDNTRIQDSVRIKLRQSRKWIQFPRFMTADLAEFIGYIAGDGHITNRYIEVTTADEEVIRRITTLTEVLFTLTPAVMKDPRSKAYRVSLASNTLAALMTRIFEMPAGKKGPNLRVPHCLESSPDEVVSRFLRAYFDCDGSICQNYRNVEVTSESRLLITQVNALLRRFGIFSTVSKKMVLSKPYWKLCIEARHAELFGLRIGSLLERKQVRLAEHIRIGAGQGCGKHDMVPLGSKLKEIREMTGCSIGKIQDFTSISYGIYEKKGRISREALGKLSMFYASQASGEMQHILQLIQQENDMTGFYTQGKLNAVLHHYTSSGLIERNSEGFSVTESGLALLVKTKNYDKTQSLTFLTALSTSDVSWIQVRAITQCPSPEYVYDLTVEENHSFMANGIIVHNTTSCGKLATYFKRKGLRPALIAGDVHRPAAYEQLKQIAEQVEVPFYGDKNEKHAVSVIKEGLNKFKRSADVIIVDTSGRHKLEDGLIQEMKDIFKVTKPDEKLLVMDAAMGQQAGPQAKAFNDAIGITGIVLTKLDGTAKGGGALSAASEVGAPIVFVGTGEHSADFEKFDPSGFISRLLGMGDINSLLERAEESMKGKDAEKTARKMMSGKFNLNDMYEQMNMISGMGPLSKVAEMLPGGLSGRLKSVDMDETQQKLKRFRIILDSMTNHERENPELIQASRVKRIARGAGVENKDVKEVLKYYNMTKRMMKGFSSDRKMRRNLMRQLDMGK
jgi:signal recognition particle subunit SRP54